MFRSATWKMTLFLSVIALFSTINAHADPAWVNIQSVYNGQCLDVQWGNSNNGTPIQRYACNGTGAQWWYSYMGLSGPIFTALAGGNSKVIDWPGDRDITWLWDYWGGDNQKWQTPWLEIRSTALPDKCLTDTFGLSAFYAGLSDCAGRTDWYFNQILFFDARTRQIRTNNNNRCLTRPTDQYPYFADCDPSNNAQQWLLYSSGIHPATSDGSQWCLDLENNQRITYYRCTGNVAQKFFGRGLMVNTKYNRCLQIPADPNMPYATFDICTGDGRQLWNFRW